MANTGDPWKLYARNLVEMRPYVPGEDMDGITILQQPQDVVEGGMVARSLLRKDDMWYVPPWHASAWEEVPSAALAGK